MRKIITSLCLLIAVLSVQAAPLKGIRIESAGQPIVVYIDGEQVCTATNSCFVANLPNGYYKVEVYAAIPGRRGDTGTHRGELLYNERVRYNARNIFDIAVASRENYRPTHRTDLPDQRGDNSYREVYDVMNDASFSRFMQSAKSTPFDSDRKKMIETALVTSYFTSDQCLQLVRLYTFDSDRMPIMKNMYPKIVDKSNFFVVIETLTHSINKNEMNDFVKAFHNGR